MGMKDRRCRIKGLGMRVYLGLRDYGGLGV